MRIEPLELPGVLLVMADVFEDERGFLTEVHQAERYADAGIPAAFVQDNHSRSVRGVVRGLHWQLRQPQGKLVSVIRGSIWDVVVDVRRGSATLGHWVAVQLDDASGHQLWVPPGYAHGFCVTSDVADVLYKNTAPYLPEQGRGLRWDDPDLSLPWPVEQAVVSAKDAALPRFAELLPEHLPEVGS